MINIKTFYLFPFFISLIFLQDMNSATINYDIYKLYDYFILYSFILLAISNFYTFDKETKKLLIKLFFFHSIFLLIGAINDKINFDFSFRYYYYLICPFIFSFSIRSIIHNEKNFDKIIDLIFYCSIISVSLKFTGLNNFNNYLNFTKFILGYDLKFESDIFSFIFGMFFLFYFLLKKKIKCLMAFFFILLTGKRIVLLAVIISLIVSFIPSTKIKMIKIPFLIFNFFLILTLYYLSINNSPFEDFVEQLFSISISEFNTGRSNIYGPVLEILKDPPLIGFGYGKIATILNTINGKNSELFHSDILKLTYELGIIGYLLFIYLLLNYCSIKKHTFPFLTMLLIFMISDNIITYFPVMTIFYLFFNYRYQLTPNFKRNKD